MSKTVLLKQRQMGGTRFRRPPYFRTPKLGILGCTQNIHDAPWHDPSWTLMTHTSARQFCKREPEWYFDLHPPSCFTQEFKSWNPKYFSWLKRLQTPIFMQEDAVKPWNDIPMAVRFPIERVLQEFRAYLANHPAYMIALALLEGTVEKIGLWGCQYGVDTEYSTQRGSLEYWLGRAEQAGIDIVLPVRHNTVLGFPKELYGYESHDAQGKLTGDYKLGLELRKQIIHKNDTPTVITIDTTNDPRPKLPPPPNGDPIAWDRREALFPPAPGVQ